MPGGIYDHKGPPNFIRVRAQRFGDADGEWQQMRDPDAASKSNAFFWVDNHTHAAQWSQPDWDDEWDKRYARSTRRARNGQWDEMLDPVTAKSFFRNYVTQEARWADSE